MTNLVIRNIITITLQFTSTREGGNGMMFHKCHDLLDIMFRIVNNSLQGVLHNLRGYICRDFSSFRLVMNSPLLVLAKPHPSPL